MIKKYLIGIFMLLCMFAHSQANKGKFMIQGSAGYHNSGVLSTYGAFSEKYSRNFVLADVNFGYFLSNNFAVGISGSTIYNKSIDIPDPHVNQLKYVNTHSENGVGVFARYNHTLHDSKFGFFLQLNARHYWINQMDALIMMNGDPSNKNVTKGTRIYSSLSPGLIYFINNKFSVESTLGSLYYTLEKSKSPSLAIEKTYTSTGIDFSLTQINFGFTYYF
jgi:hypothetical protein